MSEVEGEGEVPDVGKPNRRQRRAYLARVRAERHAKRTGKGGANRKTREERPNPPDGQDLAPRAAVSGVGASQVVPGGNDATDVATVASHVG